MEKHGRATFTWDENVLYMQTFGPFNEEGTIETAITYQKVISDGARPPFSIIEVWDPETLASPRSADEIGKFWNTLSQAGCTALAIVVANTTQEWVAANHLPDIGKIFHSKQEAEEWIERQRT